MFRVHPGLRVSQRLGFLRISELRQRLVRTLFGVAASTREIDLQNLRRVPRFGESIDRQESENQTEVLGFELTDHQMDRQ